jgi:hypothetical protein
MVIEDQLAQARVILHEGETMAKTRSVDERN